MPIQSQTIDVPIIALKQSWPTANGVAGRLVSLNNAIAKRWLEGEMGNKLRVEKRDGFVPFGSTVRDNNGNTSTKTLNGTSMLASRNSQLIALAGASILACSRDNNEWISPDYVCPINELTESLLVGHGVVGDTDILPDSSHVTGLTLTTWTETIGAAAFCLYQVTDSDGTVIRQPTQLTTGVGFFPGVVTKTVADGSRFWIVSQPGIGAAYGVFVYDLNGTLLASDTVNLPVDAAYFDIVPNTNAANGFVFLQRSGAGPNISIRKVTWNGAAIVIGAASIGVGGCSTGRLAFLRNDSTSHKYHAVSVDGAGPYDFYKWSIDDATLVCTRSNLVLGQTAAPVEITGWVNSTPDYTVVLSFLGATTQVNYTEIWTQSGGAATLRKTRKSLSVVSRPLLIDSKYYVIAYYQSDPSGTTLTNNVQQSTFYLVDLNSLYSVCGEWAKGTAYADWQRTGGTWFQLSTPVLRQDGSTHVALNFRARSFTTYAPIAFRQTLSLNGTTGRTAILGNKPVNTIGINDYSFGSKLRQSAELNNETLIPGTRVTSWEGVPSSHGISLVPEFSTAPAVAAAGSGLAVNGTFEVVCVAEWTDAIGQRVRSIAGAPYAFSTGAGDRQATYTVYALHNDVGKDNLVISFYRTTFINGIQSTQHYKVTNDLSPVFNDDGVATISFVDTMTDAVAANNEILYVDKGFLDRVSCPPFSSSCSDSQRTYVVGYDGAVWFSGSKAEGDATWFNPLFRILTNDDKPRSVAILDGNLVIFGRSNSVYVVPVSALPANDGSGSIPIPQRLPMTHGCTGPVCVESPGVFFPSTQGGIWLLTRSLQDVFVGKDVKTFVEANGPVVDCYLDDNGRACFLMTTGLFAVYDTVSGAWSTNSTPNVISTIGVNQGELIIASGSPTVIEHQSPGAVTDGGSTAVVTSFSIQYQLGGVRNFKRIWDMQTQGEYLGDHDLTVNGYFDDDLSTVVETYLFTPDAVGNPRYVYDLPPKVEECANLTLEFIDSFPRGASAGFALEMVSFELGIEKALDRLSPTTRRKSAT